LLFSLDVIKIELDPSRLGSKPKMKGLTTVATLNGILISGRTYDIREQLKALGGVWKPELKAWLVPSNTDIKAITKPYWVCCHHAKILDYSKKYHTCKTHGRDMEHFFINGRLYTGD